jgi:dinuclear metal center YbgI/SA1388 family protein
MTVRDIQNILEKWAPKEYAWKTDNVGLQVGNLNQRVNRILVTLDLTEEIVDEAKAKKIDLIISHHPLFYQPIKSVTNEHRAGKLTSQLLLNKISLYSLHTNLDFADSGVSITLAEELKLKDIDFLKKATDLQKKIVVFVPLDSVYNVMKAMADAGAGNIGNYNYCSFRTEGIGTFRGSKKAKPFIGKRERIESVSETRLEMIAPSWKISLVVEAMKASHPYEEVAFDVYNIENPSGNTGAGAIGNLDKKISLNDFLAYTKKTLKIQMIRYSGSPRHKIQRVAVCGGSGSDLLGEAIRNNADAFITRSEERRVGKEC